MPRSLLFSMGEKIKKTVLMKNYMISKVSAIAAFSARVDQCRSSSSYQYVNNNMT